MEILYYFSDSVRRFIAGNLGRNKLSAVARNLWCEFMYGGSPHTLTTKISFHCNNVRKSRKVGSSLTDSFIMFVFCTHSPSTNITFFEPFLKSAWRKNLAGCNVRKVLADLLYKCVCDWWRYFKTLCDVKFSQIAGNGWKFRHIELCNSVISLFFLTVCVCVGMDMATTHSTVFFPRAQDL